MGERLGLIVKTISLCHFGLLMLACLVFFSARGSCEEKVTFSESALEFFEKDVRPILVARCFECHSGIGASVKGGLNLDSRDALLRGGDTGPAVELDKPSGSLFVSAINYGDIYQMPPKSKLPASEIAVLTKWVEIGLPWPRETKKNTGTVKPFDLTARAAEHWCWQPVKETAPPSVKSADWPLTDIDRFILAKLESEKLKPAPDADKRVLLRRVYFDLIGLPPSPEEVEEFVQDRDPKAFEHVVDRLLGSVHYAERWARHWLDLARYAETRGHEFEPVIPNAWQYRDYVIRAINADVPYDRFLTEQVAGDLIEPRWRATANDASSPALPINDALIGTGFWFLGEEVHSPVDIRKDETDRIDNRLDVLSKTFLGLTVGCARCHDHKFDAISQRDYYALAGYTISANYRQLRVDTYEQHQRIARQLDELRSQALQETAKSIVEATGPVLDQLDQYLMTAMQALDESIATASETQNQSPSPAPTKIVERLSSEKKLDSKLLSRWVAELNSAKTDKGHLLHPLFEVGPGDSKTTSATTDALTTDANKKAAESIPGLVVDFGDLASAPIMQDGVSFGLRPVERGSLVIDGPRESPNVRVAVVGGWERDLFWKKISLTPGTEVDNGTLGAWQLSGKMVRTPEFTMTAKKLWYLVRGSVRAYASVNSHLIVVGPLHGGVMREIKHADNDWHWVQHGLELYQDHRMHVEFSPADDNACTIAMVIQSDQQPALPTPRLNSLADQKAIADTCSHRSKRYQEALRESVDLMITKTETKPASREQAYLADWFVTHRPLFTTTELALPKLVSAEAEESLATQVKWESRLAPAILDGNGVDEYLLVRGNSSTPKGPIPRRFLEAVTSRSTDGSSVSSGLPGNKTGSGRLELAQEMIRSPLAARVAVNRIWYHLFGRGIVPTVDNLGVLGFRPSHPELLDHLATQFIRDGWSSKSMIRSLVLSRTYQMSSNLTDAETADPNNELWHRMPLKRLEGEVIRDSLLAVSGRLDRTPFGVSVPIHLTEFMQGRGRPGGSGPLDGNGRRSIYISVRRNFLSPMMLAFDTPSPFSTVGRRTVSNVPAQALILMNDPLVIEQANRWAERLLSSPSKTTEQRIDQLYLMGFARHPLPAETSEAIAFLNSQGADRSENQREAWNNLCHVMFNVKEFVFIE